MYNFIFDSVTNFWTLNLNNKVQKYSSNMFVDFAQLLDKYVPRPIFWFKRR